MKSQALSFVALIVSLGLLNGCSEDSSDNDKNNEKDPLCTSGEIRCLTADDGGTVESCMNGAWNKIEVDYKACSDDGKSCQSSDPEKHECDDAQTKCETVDGKATLYTCVGNLWGKSDYSCNACDEDGKQCKPSEPENKDCDAGWGGTQCNCDLSKNYMEGNSCHPLTCKDPSADCHGAGVKTWKCSESDGSQDNACVMVDCLEGFTPINQKCVDQNSDENHNNMRDVYEISPKQGEACKVNLDRTNNCETDDGRGFCDSFINYHCATKCTDNAQCLSGFICRPDGRCASEVFESVWEVSSATNLTLQSSGSTDAYTVDWGDGKPSESFTGSGMHSHYYKDPGTYHIKITGQFTGFKANLLNNAPVKFKEVVSFGPIGLDGSAFRMTNSDIKLSEIDIPDATKLTSMWMMFYGRNITNKVLSRWDVSNVTDMRYTFSESSINEPLNDWDISNVQNLQSTFSSASQFNQPLDKWDTSKVKSMSYTFANAKAFNQSINTWNTSSVTTISHMFNEATAFNQSLDMWNTSKVQDLENVFDSAKAFDQDLSMWNLSAYKYAMDSFKNSALSKENYCKMVAGGWKRIAGEKLGMGISYNCSN